MNFQYANAGNMEYGNVPKDKALIRGDRAFHPATSFCLASVDLLLAQPW